MRFDEDLGIKLPRLLYWVDCADFPSDGLTLKKYCCVAMFQKSIQKIMNQLMVKMVTSTMAWLSQTGRIERYFR